MRITFKNFCLFGAFGAFGGIGIILCIECIKEVLWEFFRWFIGEYLEKKSDLCVCFGRLKELCFNTFTDFLITIMYHGNTQQTVIYFSLI